MCHIFFSFLGPPVISNSSSTSCLLLTGAAALDEALNSVLDGDGDGGWREEPCKMLS